MPAGIVKVTLKSGIVGKPVVVVKGKGVKLPMPTPPLVLTVQLVVGDGATTECWQTVYATATRNDARQLRAKGP